MGERSIELEEERLAALDSFNILDTAPEKAFDDIAARAKALCETSIALVTLVDKDRQWFKARVGVNVCETALETSVCAIAMRQGFLFQIDDLAADPRTARMSLVVGEPHIRFYAGFPLITRDGVPLGSLCVIDTRPRPDGLDADQREGLMNLAEEVMTLIEARRH